jgi:hypothetical protein
MQAIKNRLRPLVKTLYAQTPLKPYTEKWLKKLNEYQQNLQPEAFELKLEEVKKDFGMYQTQINLLLQKGQLILEGIADGGKTQVIENAIVIDQLAELENAYQIIGPITRKFADIYLILLKEFTAIQYSWPEKWAVNHYADQNQFQNLKLRKNDTLVKIERLETLMKNYDEIHNKKGSPNP